MDIVSPLVYQTDSLPQVITGLPGGDLIHGFQIPLSGRTNPGAVTFQATNIAYDFALGGQPFVAKINKEHPYVRKLAPIRKDQFDNQQIPGEQSLTGWWLRSQSSFVGGQGLLYQDPTQSRFGNEYGIRYGSGYGVNPWTDGQLSLLRRTVQDVVNAASNLRVRGYQNGGNNYYWQMGGTTLTSVSSSGVSTGITHNATGTLRDITSTSDQYIVMGANGVVMGTHTGAGTLKYADPVGSTRGIVGNVKGRLMIAWNNGIYEALLDGSGTATLQGQHQDPNWVWTSFAEAPDGIYISGHDNTTGQIYKITLDTSGTIPVLTVLSLNATMPYGETINSIYSYMGSFIGICTNKGFRVGEIDAQGNVAYGPLLFNYPTYSCVGYDRFFWIGVNGQNNGQSGLFRVDLGAQIQTEGGIPSVRWAYATDLIATNVTGSITSVSTLGQTDQRVFAVAGTGVYREHATELEPVGILNTGRIRFNTLENKLFKFCSVRCPHFLDGQVSVAVLDQTGGNTSLASFTAGEVPGQNDIGIDYPHGPQEWVALQFQLNRNSLDATKGGMLNGWQLKAVPGVIRQRMIQITFLLFDREVDHTNTSFGALGTVGDRLRYFEELIQTGDSVLFQDIQRNTSDLVFVEDMQFEQIDNIGASTTPKAVYGGLLTVVMRTVNDQIDVNVRNS